MKNILSYTFFVICIYFTLYNFPLAFLGLSGGTKNLLYIFLLGIIITYGKEYFNLIKFFSKECWFLVLPLLYVLLRTATGGDSGFIGKHFFGLLDSFFVPLALVLYTIKSGITTEFKFMRGFLILGAIASIISVACFFISPLHSYIKYTILDIQPGDYLYWVDFRGFGLALALVSSYAFIQAIIFVLGTFNIKDNKWFLFFLPSILFSVVFNARTGLLILLAGLIVYFVSRKANKLAFLFGGALLILMLSLPNILKNIGINSEAIRWISILFDDIDAVFATGDINASSTGSELFGSMWVLPETSSEWLVGKGYSLFRNIAVQNSDNGWILQLNYGGIIYMVLSYLIIFPICFGLLKIKRKALAIYFLIIILIVNTKSSLFPNNEVFRLLMIIYMYLKLSSKNQIA